MLRARYPVGKRSHKSHVKGRVFLEFATTLPRCVALLTVAALPLQRLCVTVCSAWHRDDYVWREFDFVRSLPHTSWSLCPQAAGSEEAYSSVAASEAANAVLRGSIRKGAAAVLQTMPPVQSEKCVRHVCCTLATAPPRSYRGYSCGCVAVLRTWQK